MSQSHSRQSLRPKPVSPSFDKIEVRRPETGCLEADRLGMRSVSIPCRFEASEIRGWLQTPFEARVARARLDRISTPGRVAEVLNEVVDHQGALLRLDRRAIADHAIDDLRPPPWTLSLLSRHLETVADHAPAQNQIRPGALREWMTCGTGGAQTHEPSGPMRPRREMELLAAGGRYPCDERQGGHRQAAMPHQP